MYCNTNFPSQISCNTIPAIQCLAYLLSHNTLYCIVIQPAQQALPTCNTPWCIAIQFLSLEAYYCNTNFLILQYKPIKLHPQGCNTIGTLQYIFFFTIVWAVAQKRFLHQILFFFFIYLLLETQKNTYPFFFSNTSNKFIEFYFHSFFFNFTHYKTLRKIFLLINFFFFTFPTTGKH